MNRQEHILQCLTEECAEVAKEISKAQRFGLDDKITLDPDGPRGTEGEDNQMKIMAEFVDLLGAYQKCVDEGFLPDVGLMKLPGVIRAAITQKGKRIENYMRYAKRVGALQ